MGLYVGVVSGVNEMTHEFIKYVGLVKCFQGPTIEFEYKVSILFILSND